MLLLCLLSCVLYLMSGVWCLVSFMLSSALSAVWCFLSFALLSVVRFLFFSLPCSVFCSGVQCLLSIIFCLLLYCLLSGVFYLPCSVFFFEVWRPVSGVFCLSCSVFCSSIFCLMSGVFNLPSSVFCVVTAVLVFYLLSVSLTFF